MLTWAQDAWAAEAAPAIPELPNFVSILRQWLGEATLSHWLHAWENVIFAWLIALSLAAALLLTLRRPSLIPHRAQNFAEWLVETLEQFFTGFLGPHTRRFLPFLGTLFLYILTMNLAVLIPFFKSPTGGITLSGSQVVSGGFVTTAALAICVFLYVQYTAIRTHGLLRYLHHLVGSPRGIGEVCLALITLAPLTHVLGELVRPLSLALRLFGNITGEDILLGVFLMLGVLALANLHVPIGLPLHVVVAPLVLLFGFVQAMIFTGLSSAYLGLALPEEHHHKGTREVE